MKQFCFILFCLFTFSACPEKGEVSVPISTDILEATYNYDFPTMELEADLVLNDYVSAYQHTMNPAEYNFGDTYRLDRFHLALVIHDEPNGNVPAAFIFKPAGSPLSEATEPVSIASPAPDGGGWFRQPNRSLSQRMVSALQSSRSRFAPYTEDGVDYLVIRYDREWLQQLDRVSRTRWAAFFVHEGFHLFPQREMSRPGCSQSSLRSNPPADYPADPRSFSLIGAGIQLNENLIYDNNPVDWQQVLAMQYVLLDQLRAADTTGQEYIDEFYLCYTWLEGGAEFIEQKITQGAGIYDYSDADTREQVSYASFQDRVRQTVLSGTSTVIVNGEPQERRYAAIVGGSYYQIGAATFRILEGLGEDPLTELARGQNPYELLDDYIETHNIVIDETAALADLKSLINWEESLELMEDYIAVFD